MNRFSFSGRRVLMLLGATGLLAGGASADPAKWDWTLDAAPKFSDANGLVDNFWFKPAQFSPGQSIKVSTYAMNVGEADAPATVARLHVQPLSYTGAEPVPGVFWDFDIPVPPLKGKAPNQGATPVPLAWDLELPASMPVGNYVLSIVVDPAHAFQSSEVAVANNQVGDSKFDVVAPSPPVAATKCDLVAESIVFYKEGQAAEVIPFSPTPQFQAGKSWVVYFHGKNAGTEASPPTTARLLLVPTSSFGNLDLAVTYVEKPIPALKPGGTFAINFNVPVGSVSFPDSANPSTYNTDIAIDPGNVVSEGNENNNKAPMKFVELVAAAKTPSSPSLNPQLHLTAFLEAYEQGNLPAVQRALCPSDFQDSSGRDGGQFVQAVAGDFRNLRNIQLQVQALPSRSSGRFTAVPLRWRRTAELAGTGQVWATEGNSTLLFQDKPPLLCRIEGDPLVGLTDVTGVVTLRRGRLDGQPLRTPLLVRNGRPETGAAGGGAFDLSVASCDVSGTTLVVSVRNGGPGSSPEATLEVMGSDGTRLTQALAPLAAGETARASFPLTPSRAGAVRLTVQVRAAGDTDSGNDSAATVLEGPATPGR